MGLIRLDQNAKDTSVSLSENGLLATSNSNGYGMVKATEGRKSGKWYLEATMLTSVAIADSLVGVCDKSAALNYGTSADNMRTVRMYRGNSELWTPLRSYEAGRWNKGDIIGTLINIDEGTVAWTKNGVRFGIGYTDLRTFEEVYPCFIPYGNGDSIKVNFGDTKFDLASKNPALWERIKREGYQPFDYMNATWDEIFSFAKANELYYSLANKEFTTLSHTPSEEEFRTLGMRNLSSLFALDSQGIKLIDFLPEEFEIVSWSAKQENLILNIGFEPFVPFDILPDTFNIETYVEGVDKANLEIAIEPLKALELLDSTTPKLLLASIDKTKRNIAITAKPPSMLVFPTKDIDLANIEGIDSVSISLTGSGGIAKIITSFDGGLNWEVFRNGAWVKIQATKETVRNLGMTQAELRAVPSTEWNSKNKKRKIRFAYYLEYDSVASDLGFDKLSMIVDLKGTFKKAIHGTDYDYGYKNNTTLSVDIRTNGTYKINYPL